MWEHLDLSSARLLLLCSGVLRAVHGLLGKDRGEFIHQLVTEVADKEVSDLQGEKLLRVGADLATVRGEVCKERAGRCRVAEKGTGGLGVRKEGGA